jgi:putative hydrolase of the HAD superfamily
VNTPIRAVLWDFGGVILTSPFDAFGRYEEQRGLPAGFLRRVNATNPDDNAWARIERSEITVDEFLRLFEDECRALGHEVEAAAVIALLQGELRPAMVHALRRCKEEGFATAMLTNNVVVDGEAGTRASPMAAVLELFDVIIESSKVGVRKPDPRFYSMACEALGIEPAEAVFLDDLGINLKPARAMGMTTIKVDDPDTAIAELESILGVPLSSSG